MTITIKHTRQHGTLVYGTVRGDGAGKILSPLNFSGSEWLPIDEELGDPYWYLPHSQRSSADRWKLNRAKQQLEEAGFEVAELVIDNVTPAYGFAELEARKYEHASYRADRLEDRSANAATISEDIRARNKQTYDMLNGTPLLVDHYSYNRHKNLLERLWKREGKAWDLWHQAGELMGRAEAARDFQGRREAHGTTLRRIQRKEKRLRDIERRMEGKTEFLSEKDLEARLAECSDRGIPAKRTGTFVEMQVPQYGAEPKKLTLFEIWVGISDGFRAELIAETVELVEEIGYWEDLIAASGKKVWRKEDFAKGDFAVYGKKAYEVTRVSQKSVTIISASYLGSFREREIVTVDAVRAATRHPRTDTVPFDKITGKLSREEAERRYPAEFAVLLKGEPLPKHTSAKRPKKALPIKIEGRQGSELQWWDVQVGDERFEAAWKMPEYGQWYAPPTVIEAAEPIKVYADAGPDGFYRKRGELVAEIPVANIRWVEDVHNLVVAWAEKRHADNTAEKEVAA
ncbi:DUF3560 domain-containing protein [Actinomadura atramentaria]|uniref:DUF3560 domain-containing protein n=1 Tax=Actinomadura atramentaria TaxID=1990 RepID=UPI000360A6C0|nr:DUF3560 domain-containing protein [Actinomadura atramentaria]